jgi:hypothetical protein
MLLGFGTQGVLPVLIYERTTNRQGHCRKRARSNGFVASSNGGELERDGRWERMGVQRSDVC